MPVGLPTPERAQRKRRSLTRAEVVDGALAIIDESGFGALTMRALATRLEAYPASLYWHAGNRDQLLALVCQRVLETVSLPDDDAPWQEWALGMARSTRAAFAEHPNLAPYLVSQLQVSLVSLAFAERTLTALRRGGFEGERLLRAYNALVGAVFGWIGGEFADDPDAADAEWRRHFEQQLREGGDDFPTLREMMPTVANRAFFLRWSSGKVMPMEPSFEAMVEALLLGLEQQRTGV